MNLYERMLRTQKTVDAYKGRPFKDGTADCIQLVRTHVKHMGKPVKVPAYHDLKGAAAALKAMGHKTLAEAMDARFMSIAPDQVLVGDIVEMPGANGFSSLSVAVGNGRVIGFHEDIPHADILQPLMISGAWRIREFASKKARSRSRRAAT